MSLLSTLQAKGAIWVGKLDEPSGTVIEDYSGNNRDGTWVNSPGLGATGGIPSEPSTLAVDLTPNDHGLVDTFGWPDQPGLNEPLSFVTFFRADSLTSRRALMSFDNNASSPRGIVFYLNAGRMEPFQSSALVLGATTLTTGTWYMAAMTYAGNGTNGLYKVYYAPLTGTPTITLDGTSSALGMRVADDLLQIGMSYAGTASPNFAFDGKMQYASLFDTALSSTDLQDILDAAMSASSGVQGVFDAQVAGVTSDLAGTVEGDVQGVFDAQVAGVTSDLAGSVGTGGGVEGTFDAQVAGITSALEGWVNFEEFDEPRTGIGVRFASNAYHNVELSVVDPEELESIQQIEYVAASVPSEV
jgi:hypothetical protein